MTYQDWRTLRGHGCRPLLYSWDTDTGWCGVTDSRTEAFGLVTDALRRAGRPATGQVGKVTVSTVSFQAGYELLGLLGRATRDDRGAIQWHSVGSDLTADIPGSLRKSWAAFLPVR